MSRIRLAPIALFNVTSGAELSVTLPMTADPGPGGVAAHDLQRAFRVLGRDKRNKPSFARNVQRVKPEHFAGGVNVFAHRHGFFHDFDAHRRRFGDFVERAGQSAAGQVAQTMNFNSGFEQFQNNFVNGRGIAFDGALELQPFTHGHDGHAVPAQIAAHQHGVAGPDVPGCNDERVFDDADAGGVDEQAVALALVHDLGVTGDDLHAAALCGVAASSRRSARACPSAGLPR